MVLVFEIFEKYYVNSLGTEKSISICNSKVCHNFPLHHKFMSDFLFPFYLSIILKEEIRIYKTEV